MSNNTQSSKAGLGGSESADTGLAKKNKRLIVRLFSIIAVMFCFGFALVPLYDVFCQVTGINGRNVVKSDAPSVLIDRTRTVRIQFTTSVAPGMPWQFKPMTKSIDVHPGENKVVKFSALNPTSSKVVGQAIPSVAPGLASLYLNKTECFCFNQQALDGGEQVEMGLVFFISTDIPKHIKTMTLSYTLFNVSESVAPAEIAAL